MFNHISEKRRVEKNIKTKIVSQIKTDRQHTKNNRKKKNRTK